jgi:hypothetical protein
VLSAVVAWDFEGLPENILQSIHPAILFVAGNFSLIVVIVTLECLKVECGLNDLGFGKLYLKPTAKHVQ